MTDLANPAGRLHALLAAFERVSGDGRSIQAAWAEVLGVTEQDVPFRLGDLSRLMREVREAALDVDSPVTRTIPGHLVTLGRTIFPVNTSFGRAAADVRPDDRALEALGYFSLILERGASLAKFPPDCEVDELHDQFVAAREAVAQSSLPSTIKLQLLLRLDEMIEALSSVNLGGPDAVRRAAEALAATLRGYEPENGAADAGEETPADDARQLWPRLWGLTKKAWTGFTVAVTLASGVSTFDRIAGTEILPALPAATEPAQLEPGPPSEPESDASDDGLERI